MLKGRFPLNRVRHHVIGFIPDELCDRVFLSECRASAVTMGENSCRLIGRHTDVKRSIPLARKNVNMTLWHAFMLLGLGGRVKPDHGEDK